MFAASRCFPLCSRTRTLLEAVGMSQTCQEQTTHFGLRAGPISALLHLDVSRSDHFTPLLRLIGDEFAEVSGRTVKHYASAHNGKPHLHLGIGKGGVDLFVELFDYLCGCALGTQTPHQVLAS